MADLTVSGASATAGNWQIWVDTGGTFTDCLALSPTGQLHRAKVLSSSSLRARLRRRIDARALQVDARWPGVRDFCRGYKLTVAGNPQMSAVAAGYDPTRQILHLDREIPRVAEDMTLELSTGEEAPVLAARVVTGTPADEPLPLMQLRLATTRGTNALLERVGAPTVLFITRGFADLLRIGDQQRPDLFALNVIKPMPLYAAVVEVDERLDAAGDVLHPLSLQDVPEQVASLLSRGIRSAAIALLHAYRNPAHEEVLADCLRDAGMETISISSQLAPLIKILPRAQTAVVDAYLSPIVGGYLDRVAAVLQGQDLHVMTSAGGLTRRADFRTKDSLLSGPAGGVAGAAEAARRAGFERILSFDMGGTSTDVARYDGDFDYDFEHRVGDAHLVAPALSIETVAAGGGSICSYAGGRLRVGPESAGAHPGPACYGAGGPLTVTDVNLLLGRLDAAQFEIPVDRQAAQDAMDQLHRQMLADCSDATVDDVLSGLVAIADDRMAAAIRRVSLERGVDPAEFTLVAFGGAGGQHACGVATRLGIERVLIPADAGLLSARGLGAAAIERFAQRQILRPLDDVEGELDRRFAALGREAIAAVEGEGGFVDGVEVRRQLLYLRLQGQESSVAISYRGSATRDEFNRAYRDLYGHNPPARPIEVESLRVVASTAVTDVPLPLATTQAAEPAWQAAWTIDGWRDIQAVERSALTVEESLSGPALVFERHSATFVDAGWSVLLGSDGGLLLERSGPQVSAVAPPQPEAVRLALFTHALESVAREMGTALQRTALSTNVKERLDFSCGVLDGAGRLVVNAPHIPVHLGALGLCVREVAQALELGLGDTAITNHPGFGGSHLPDVTLVTPVHADSGCLLGWVASRAHHAEIGGTRPGSMPPDARSLQEEGVVIPPRYLVRDGAVLWEEIEQALTAAPHPSRSVADNLADLEAALAANHRGRHALQALARTHGEQAVADYMEALRNEASAGVRRALAARPDGLYEATETLDDGTPIVVRITVDGDAARIDFSGSGDVHPGNLNATPAIVYSAITYVLRLLVSEDLPLNEGFLAPVDVVLPPGLLNPPFARSGDPAGPASPAVAGGNVETSQRLVDTLLKALDLVAGSQGTMNNTLFGNERFGYYETVCGGTGAGPGFDGTDAIHSHMTNTRITDPEIVEQRYPVRVERFQVREESGGAGRWRGGDGCIRELRFLAPVSLSLLTQHRRTGPYGLHGGEDGSPGRQQLLRAHGGTQELGAVDSAQVEAGDRLLLETPGGGGYGASDRPE